MPGNSFPKVIRNTGATIFIRGCFGIARIFLLLVIAKKFGPADFGALSLALSFSEIFKVVADFGVDTVLLRRFVVNKALSARLLGNGLTLKLLSATAAYFIANAVCWLLYKNVGAFHLLLIIAASLYTTLLVNAFVSYFQANLNSASIVVPNAASTIVYILLTVFGVHAGWSLGLLAAIIPFCELINLAATARVFSMASSLRMRFDKKIIWSIIIGSVPVGVAGIVVVIYSRLDVLMIEWFLGQKQLGEYAFAYRLTEPFLLLFSSLSISIYAFFSGMSRSSDIAAIKQKMIKVIVPVAIAGILCAAGLSISANWLTSLVSDKYAGAGSVLPVLAFAIVFKALNAQLTALINSGGKYKYITYIALNNLAINVILNLLLIPAAGIKGAAFAAVSTEAINTVVQSVCVFYVFSFSFKGAGAGG